MPALVPVPGAPSVGWSPASRYRQPPLILRLPVVCLFLRDSRSACPIAHSSASYTSILPVPRWLQKDFQPSLCFHTAAAPTIPSSVLDPSVHHNQTPVPTLASFSLAQRITSLLAATSSLSMTVLTTGS